MPRGFIPDDRCRVPQRGGEAEDAAGILRRFFQYTNLIIKFRGVAQLVARLLWEQDAAGSSPVTPTKKAKKSYLVGFLRFLR